jgi:ATP-dependent DNA ligase
MIAIRFPYAPMEALSVDRIPVGPEWQYEPKWDGFRCIIFRNGASVVLQSKSGKPLTWYFPDIVAAAGSLSARQFVLDGEIVVPRGSSFSFDDLLQRIHPATSRVKKLAAETPAIFIAFDLLAEGEGKLTDLPLRERRKHLDRFAKRHFAKNGSIRISPMALNVSAAKLWLRRAGAALDGIIAKRRDFAYRSGDRSGMQKVKHFRSADCVVGGFRYNQGQAVVGSLLLGLYDDAGLLHHVGFASNIPRESKPFLTNKLEKLVGAPGFTGNAPGGPSRWSSERSAEWKPLKPKLVVEVCFDHFSDGRFRHGTRLIRFRPDKAPWQCSMDQATQKEGKLLKLLT